jgi:hypothetical protein
LRLIQRSSSKSLICGRSRNSHIPIEIQTSRSNSSTRASEPDALCGELIGRFASNTSPIEKQSIYLKITWTLFHETITSRFSTRQSKGYGRFTRHRSRQADDSRKIKANRHCQRILAKPLMHLATKNEFGLRRNAVTVADPEKHLVEAWNFSTGLFF